MRRCVFPKKDPFPSLHRNASVPKTPESFECDPPRHPKFHNSPLLQLRFCLHVWTFQWTTFQLRKNFELTKRLVSFLASKFSYFENAKGLLLVLTFFRHSNSHSSLTVEFFSFLQLSIYSVPFLINSLS